MADIVTNTLQIGSNNLVLRDADAQTKIATNTQQIATNTQDISTLKEETDDLKSVFKLNDINMSSIPLELNGSGISVIPNINVIAGRTYKIYVKTSINIGAKGFVGLGYNANIEVSSDDLANGYTWIKTATNSNTESRVYFVQTEGLTNGIVYGYIEDITEKVNTDNKINTLENVEKFISAVPSARVFTELHEASSELTTGNAWDISGTPVTGSQYNYATYTITANDYIVYVTGASWGANYPLVSFYDAGNALVSTFGTTGNSRYLEQEITIPTDAVLMIVNGYEDATYTAKIFKYGQKTQAALNRSLIKPYGTDIGSDYIASHSSFSNLRNWPANTIYNLATSAHTAIENVPEGFNTFGSLIKYIGYIDPDATHMGYSGYLIISPTGAWAGFDNGSEIIWHPVVKDSNEQKTILFIGDSYAQGYSHDGTNLGWCRYVAEYMGLDSSSYVISANGGASFSNSSNSFISLLNAASSKDYTDIVVCGGFNDYPYDQNTILSNMSAFFDRCKALYPNATIHLGCIGWIKAGSGTSAISDWESVRTALTTVVLPTYKQAIRSGAQYLNNVEFMLGESGLTPTDGYHPSEAGNKAIAEGVANAILTGSAPIPYNSSLRAT